MLMLMDEPETNKATITYKALIQNAGLYYIAHRSK